ncbi:hypothetical protein BDV93DRAFT_611078 [Ceratobasidium sp. AG-I]|nr:hypothetical protein BDV93DRAFT_611078 [Ceratobasidium sp. AG-I]
MSIVESDKYYFPRGDLVLQIENTLFRVHQDIMVLHSGFFESMYSTPSSDDKEGTSDDNPLHLSKDLCSAQAFTMICKFLYQPILGVLPTATVKELDVWEPVLYATVALEFLGIQENIAKQLSADKKNFLTSTSRLLNIANRINSDELKLDCYYEFVYRTIPLSLSEFAILEGPDLPIITQVRELVRDDVWILTRADVDTSALCRAPSTCSQNLVQLIRKQLGKRNQAHMAGSIFDIPEASNLCTHCDSQRSKLASGCRTKKLDEKVRKWVSDLQSRRLAVDNSESAQATVS